MTGNVLEIFRRLPGTNCAVCGQKGCMAFAVLLATGTGNPEDCPFLDDQVRSEIRPLLAHAGDWRENLCRELIMNLPGYDPQDYPSALGLRPGPSGHGLRIRYLGSWINLDESGFTEHCSPWDRILVLRYLIQGGSEPLRGTWSAFRNLRNGMVKAAAFHRECEAPLASIMDRNLAGCSRALETLDARSLVIPEAPNAWDLPALPAIPFRILFRPREDDSRPDCRILLDPSATTYLDVESLIFLGERIVERVAELAGP